MRSITASAPFDRLLHALGVTTQKNIFDKNIPNKNIPFVYVPPIAAKPHIDEWDVFIVYHNSAVCQEGKIIKDQELVRLLALT